MGEPLYKSVHSSIGSQKQAFDKIESYWLNNNFVRSHALC